MLTLMIRAPRSAARMMAAAMSEYHAHPSGLRTTIGRMRQRPASPAPWIPLSVAAPTTPATAVP